MKLSKSEINQCVLALEALNFNLAKSARETRRQYPDAVWLDKELDDLTKDRHKCNELRLKLLGSSNRPFGALLE